MPGNSKSLVRTGVEKYDDIDRDKIHSSFLKLDRKNILAAWNQEVSTDAEC